MPWQKGQIFFVDPPGIISQIWTDRQTDRQAKTKEQATDKDCEIDKD